jgi:hypothetical protein
MGRIKDQSYTLRNIFALSIRDVLVNSQNQPFIIKGVDEHSHKSGYFILKPNHGNRILTDYCIILILF